MTDKELSKPLAPLDAPRVDPAMFYQKESKVEPKKAVEVEERPKTRTSQQDMRAVVLVPTLNLESVEASPIEEDVKGETQNILVMDNSSKSKPSSLVPSGNSGGPGPMDSQRSGNVEPIEVIVPKK